jgi:DNA-directed RNA polymerase specialized sigma24 family protein
VEQLLEIFCQDYVSNDTEQLLEFDDFDNRSQEFRDLARPLVYAVSDPQVRKVMTIEDEMSIHFQNVKYVTDENEALHSMIEESNRMLQEKDSQLQEKDSQLQETNQQLANSIKLLYSAGLSVDDIAAKLGIPVDKIQTIV